MCLAHVEGEHEGKGVRNIHKGIGPEDFILAAEDNPSAKSKSPVQGFSSTYSLNLEFVLSSNLHFYTPVFCSCDALSSLGKHQGQGVLLLNGEKTQFTQEFLAHPVADFLRNLLK